MAGYEYNDIPSRPESNDVLAGGPLHIPETTQSIRDLCEALKADAVAREALTRRLETIAASVETLLNRLLATPLAEETHTHSAQ